MFTRNDKARVDRALAQVAMAQTCPDTLLSVVAVMTLTGWSKPTLYRRGKDGTFPRPVTPGRWHGGQVLSHIATKAGR